ncbi:hypothetical protein HY768_03890 [candidate division TA06 bacterium]|uniref:Uncharacterized protein n=1 Tax=candidate division TA06 bacterium TaxID=2250710 RepID=A0A933IAL9_UNCT6|nr:hypothetical protein [candidate division TA06 bacterium]
MVLKEEIIGEIEERVKNANVIAYHVWYIGTADSPPNCKTLYDSPNILFWQAESPEIALKIKELFLHKGMKEAYGVEGKKPEYVFIF